MSRCPLERVWATETRRHRSFGTSSERKQTVQSKRKARPLSNAPHGKQYSRHERRPVEGIVADAEHLTEVSQQYFLMRKQASESYGVDVYPLDPCPASRCITTPLRAVWR